MNDSRFLVLKIREIQHTGDVHIIYHGEFSSYLYELSKGTSFPTSGEYRVVANIDVEIPDKLLGDLFDQIMKLQEFSFLKVSKKNTVWDNYRKREFNVIRSYTSIDKRNYPINVGIANIKGKPQIILGTQKGTYGQASWGETYKNIAKQINTRLEEGLNMLIAKIKREKVIKSLEKTGKVIEKKNNGLQTIVTLKLR